MNNIKITNEIQTELVRKFFPTVLLPVETYLERTVSRTIFNVVRNQVFVPVANQIHKQCGSQLAEILENENYTE